MGVTKEHQASIQDTATVRILSQPLLRVPQYYAILSYELCLPWPLRSAKSMEAQDSRPMPPGASSTQDGTPALA